MNQLTKTNKKQECNVITWVEKKENKTYMLYMSQESHV